MSIVIDQDIPPEALELWQKSLVNNSGSYGIRTEKKDIIYRKRNFVSLIARSSFQSLAQIWDGLTTAQKSDWDDAGYYSGMSGWDLFVVDTLYRIRNGIFGIATPDLYHQYFVGKISIEAPAESIKLRQVFFGLSNDYINCGINYFSDLTSTGSGSYARFIGKLTTGFWNDDTNSPEVVTDTIDLVADGFWGYDDFSFFDPLSASNKLEIIIEVYKMRGVLYIDDIELFNNDTNIILDPLCEAIQNNWSAVDLPSGAGYESMYPPDNF